MDQLGFIHDKLDIKILILFVLRRLPAPVDPQTLLDLCQVDDGMGYFDYSDCISDLLKSGHMTESEEGFQITEKGARNADATESSLPYSVRSKAQIEALGVDCEYRYDVTTLRNTTQILLSHIKQEADSLENERLVVMMGGLVVTSPFAKILHNSTTHRLMRRLETYRNVYVFSVPYVIE